jgi:hypothetical protein
MQWSNLVQLFQDMDLGKAERVILLAEAVKFAAMTFWMVTKFFL